MGLILIFAPDSSLFSNQFPDEETPRHIRPVAPSQLLKVRGARWFDYVVLEDGDLILGHRVVGQGHANLARGQPIQAAGQVQISSGRILEIDNASGQYLPAGPVAGLAAIAAFRQANFPALASIYIEKFWNLATLSREPLNAGRS